MTAAKRTMNFKALRLNESPASSRSRISLRVFLNDPFTSMLEIVCGETAASQTFLIARKSCVTSSEPAISLASSSNSPLSASPARQLTIKSSSIILFMSLYGRKMFLKVFAKLPDNVGYANFHSPSRHVQLFRYVIVFHPFPTAHLESPHTLGI